jgi:hypothetical protein
LNTRRSLTTDLQRLTARGFGRSKAQDSEVDDVKRRTEQRATKAYRESLRLDPEAYVMQRARKSRAELHDLVWSKPMIEAGAELDISESTLRQLCNDHAIPTPPRGHFNHLDPIDRMPQTPLPEFPETRRSRSRR